MFFKSLQKIINSFELKSLCMTPWLSTQPPISAKPLIDTYAAANQFILHLNASETNLITQGGRGRNLLTTISSWSIVLHSSKVKLLFCSSSVRILFYSFISFTSCLTNLSAFFLFRSTLLSSKFFFRARFTLMLSLGCFCSCTVSLSFMAKILLLGHFQNFDPVLKRKNYLHKLYKLFLASYTMMTFNCLWM